MRDPKRRRLEAKGWKFGNAKEFLRLSAEEAAYIDLKARLAIGLRERRRRRSLTQADLANRLQSSQSRIAKMEAGDPSVSLDLLVRSLLILGTSRQELSRIISARSPEIGRASCREKSVDLGGRRIIKKKKREHRICDTRR